MLRWGLPLGAGVIGVCVPAINVFATTEAQQIQQLQRIIAVQQQELNQNRRDIHTNRHQLNHIKHAQKTSATHTVTHIKKSPLVTITRKNPLYGPLRKRAWSSTNRVYVPGHLVKIGTDKANLQLSGQINELLMFAGDGQRYRTYFGTNTNSNSRFNVNSEFKPSSDWTIGSKIQLGFNVNMTNAVSQTAPTSPPVIDMRKIELFISSKRFGTVYLGKGKTASDDSVYSDLSATFVLSRATLGDIGGGLFYYDPSTGVLSGLNVNTTINGLDGFARRNRLRYDTPVWHGFNLLASWIEGNRYDFAARYADHWGRTQFAASLAYTSPQTIGQNAVISNGDVMSGSASILFPCGISLTGAGAEQFAQVGRDNPHYFYVKPGYQILWNGVGVSGFSIDMARYYNFAQNNDRATSYGVDYVQNIDAWDFAAYTGYRHFHLDRPGNSFDNINTVVVGGFYKF